jgi:uncharacterized membrane protein (UPF0182 family)
VIPLGNAMLYFEPIYLRAAYEAAIPELKKVILASGSRVVMTDTVEEGLRQLLSEAKPSPGAPPAAAPPAPGTPRPTPVPVAATAPTDLKTLARQANRVYREAQDALKVGDWATYGAKMKQLEQLLRQMEQHAQ